jgi:hypothetical protein
MGNGVALLTRRGGSVAQVGAMPFLPTAPQNSRTCKRPFSPAVTHGLKRDSIRRATGGRIATTTTADDLAFA